MYSTQKHLDEKAKFLKAFKIYIDNIRKEILKINIRKTVFLLCFVMNNLTPVIHRGYKNILTLLL